MPQELLKVLLVDDDPLGRRLLARSLIESGFDVIECRDGLEALQLLEATGPALLVLDYEMPEFNGAQICELLRTSSQPEIREMPIILLTAHSGEEHEIECLNAGADDFVIKPVNLAVLRARIGTLLRLHSMHAQLQRQNYELEEWRRNHEADLESARRTQQAILPQANPEIAGWKLAARYLPLIQVGGDMYDYRRLRDGSLLICTADATGHGASGALLTTLTKLLFRHSAADHTSPAAVLQAVNRDLHGVFKGRSFMSTSCIALQPGAHSITWCGAGHPPLLVIRRDGSVQFFESAGPPVGLQRDIEIQETVVDISAGDAFMVYTDGLYGMNGARGERLTHEELASLVQGPIEDPERFLDELIDRVKARAREGAFTDDVTAVAALRCADV